MTRPSSDRCGYRLEIGLTHDDIATGPCERPTWEDHDRCVWHAPVDGKTQKTFEGARPAPGDNLDGAYLRESSLVGVDWFAGTSLVGADFTGADVKGTDFSEATMVLATLSDASAMNASFRGANLEGAILTNADLRRATLADARISEAVLTDVHVGGGTEFGDVSVYEGENARPTLNDEYPLKAASWAYRQLQEICQENALPRLAQRSYTREKDARRRLAWDRRNYPGAIKWELSRWVMHYGSSPYRVLGSSFLVILVAAVLFPLTGGIQEIQDGQAITYTIENPETAAPWWIGRVLFKSLYFSVVTFATLGYGDIQPIGSYARFLAGVEALLGSLLAALLVFVLARIVTW